jgi:tripartite-type tricarboxylate transporter receptor subunit TctC
MFAPAGTPAAIVERVSTEVKTVLSIEDLKKRLNQEGADIDYQSPVEYHRFVVEEIVRWTGVVKKAKVKID